MKTNIINLLNILIILTGVTLYAPVQTVVEESARVVEPKKELKFTNSDMLANAAYKGSKEVVANIIEFMDSDAINGVGEVDTDLGREKLLPIIAALKSKNFKNKLEIIEILLKKGADVTILGPGNNSVLHFAAVTSGPIIQKILDADTDKVTVDQLNNLGQTPLILAIKNNPDVVAALLKAQASVNIPDNDRNIPLDLAKARMALKNNSETKEIVSLLESAGAKTAAQLGGTFIRDELRNRSQKKSGADYPELKVMVDALFEKRG